MHRVQITSEGVGGTVVVDGKDISRGLHGATIRLAARRATEVELDLDIAEIETFESENTRVIIPEGTRDVLIGLGWTPPAEVTT